MFGARRANGLSRGASQAVRASAAAGGASDADPWKALGVPQGADADAIKKALDRKKLLYKSEPEKLAAMETAYESIVQASLAARLATPRGIFCQCAGDLAGFVAHRLWLVQLACMLGSALFLLAFCGGAYLCTRHPLRPLCLFPSPALR